MADRLINNIRSHLQLRITTIFDEHFRSHLVHRLAGVAQSLWHPCAVTSHQLRSRWRSSWCQRLLDSPWILRQHLSSPSNRLLVHHPPQDDFDLKVHDVLISFRHLHWCRIPTGRLLIIHPFVPVNVIYIVGET